MRFQLYRQLTLGGKRWAWRLKADNNKIIATSGESYHNKQDALDAIEMVQGSLIAEIVEK